MTPHPWKRQAKDTVVHKNNEPEELSLFDRVERMVYYRKSAIAARHSLSVSYGGTGL